MAKGKKVSWMYGGKKYSGTAIPSMETSKRHSLEPKTTRLKNN